MKYGKYMSSMVNHEKYSENARCNVGDTFQDLVIDFIFSKANINENDVVYIPRESGFIDVGSEEKVIMATNVALFQKNTETNLPLPENFYPAFISVLILHDFFNQNPQLLEYIKQHEPVGCRDEQSKAILKAHGVDAYLMGCCTICFPKRTEQPVDGKVFFVDTPRELDAYVPDNLRERAVYISHSVPLIYPVNIEEDTRQKKIATDYLERYKNEADMVVTSRLHAAIPCMAMGIPVVLVRNNFDSRFSWVDKYLPLYYLDEAEKIDWHPSVINLEDAKENVISYVKKSLLQIPGREKHLIELDAFYSERNKAVINKQMREKIDAFFQTTSNYATYGIWGAGIHCKYVQSIIQENYPNAQLKVIIDKYVEGSLFDIPIIRGEQLQKDSFNHMFITTLQGKHEAIAKMREMYGEKADEFYTVITSEMVC
jgi:hypothetical protein